MSNKKKNRSVSVSGCLLSERLEQRRLLSAVTFAAQQSYATGSGPDAIAIANLGNGHPDLVVANNADATVSVLLGNGDGTFAAQQVYAVGNLPSSVAIANLGNGHPDLIVNNKQDDTVSVLLGNGDGTFQSQQTYAVGFGPDSVAVANLGNGQPDLVVANEQDNTVSVLLGNGDGTFQTQLPYIVGAAPRSVALADLGNGQQDIVVTDSGSGLVSVLLGNGDGTFQARTDYSTGNDPTGLAIANLGNGHPDVVVTNENDNTIGVLLGNGDGTLQPQQTTAVGNFPVSVAIADLGNGVPDLVVANSTDNNIGVLLGSGNGTFGAQQTFTAGTDPLAVGVANLGNGLADIVVANDGSNTAGVLVNTTPNQLAFAEEPANGTTSATLSTVKVNIDGPSGSLLSSNTTAVTLAIDSGPPGATLGGTTTESAVGGVATFSNLTLTTAGTYILTATDGNATSTNSTSFTITVPAANELAFAQEPVSTTTSATLAAVKVNVENSSGTVLSGDTSSVTLAIASGPPGAVLGGTTTVAAVAGVATFSNLTLATAGTYTLTATDGSDASETSTSFTITAPVQMVNKLAFTQEPVSTTTTATLGPVKVSVQNSSGTPLTSDTSSITLAISAGPAGATLGGTTTIAAVAGVATFSNLTLTTAGTYTLTATDGSDTSALSTGFTITVPAANKLAFAQEPISTTTSTTLSSVKIDVENSSGTLLTSDGSSVTLAIASGPTGAVLRGTLTVATVAGVATFSDLSLATAGTYTFVATDAGDTSATSTSFIIASPAANKLAFAVQPVNTTTTATLNAISVDVQSPTGTLLTSDTSTVTLAIQSGPAGAALGGTKVVNATGGVATFTGLTLTTPGSYTLIATDAGDTSVTSVSFVISPPAANKLVFAQPPVSTTADALLTPILVDVENANGSLLTGDATSVTLTIASGSTGSTLGGTTTVSAVNGVATFSNLFIVTPGTGYTLSATDGTDVPATSGSFAITTPANHTLVFATEPSNATTVGTLSPVVVDIENASGALVTTGNATVTLALSAGTSATLGGTTTVTAISGVATFSNLSIASVGRYTLTATEIDEPSAISTGFNVQYPPVTVGQLDPAFGKGGLLKSDVGFTATDGVAQQGTQTIVIGTTGIVPSESFAVARYNADGSLDATFGTNGVATINFAGTDDVPTSLSVLSSGQILIAGTATTYNNGASVGSEFALVELNANGTPNSAFGTGNGEFIFSFSNTLGRLSNDVLNAMAVSSTGVIYLGGSSDSRGTTGSDFAVVALTPSGNPDNTFGTGGLALQDFSGGNDVINSLAIQANGDLVAAGSASIGSITQIALARYLPTGLLDNRFGVKGLVTTSVRAAFDSATSVIIEPRGQIVIGGVSATESGGVVSSDFVLVRYSGGGRIDRSFGGGPVITSFGSPSAVTQVLLQPNGDIIASGKITTSLSSINTNDLDVAVSRYTPRGILDATFDGSGKTVINLATASLVPSDASSLTGELDQFIGSRQGVVSSVSSEDILDVGNSGTSTVETEVITAGVDLSASLVGALPAAVTGGVKGSATVTIAEAGVNPARGVVTVELQIATDVHGDGAQPLKTVMEKISLAQGRSHSYKIGFVYPTTLAAGNYYLLVDVINGTAPALRELNLANNIALSASSIAFAPPFISLAGSGLSVGSAFVSGKTASVIFTLTNNGNVTARGATVLDLYLSSDLTPADGIGILSQRLVIALPAGKSHVYRVKFRLTAAASPTGFNLLAVIDPAMSLGAIDQGGSTFDGPADVVVT